MGKVEEIIKSEIVRLARKEVRKVSRPLGRDLRSLKSVVSQLRRTVLGLQRITTSQKKELQRKGGVGGASGRSEGVAFLTPFDPESSQALRHHPERAGYSHGRHRRGRASVGERTV